MKSGSSQSFPHDRDAMKINVNLYIKHPNAFDKRCREMERKVL